MARLSKDRLFPVEERSRGLARELYATTRDLPIISPHGHTDPRWFAENAPFPDPARLFVTPDHYVFRLLHSQGVPLEALGVARADGGPVETDSRLVWRLFARHFHLLRGTPSWLWLRHAFETVFGIDESLAESNADAVFDHIAGCLARPEFRPRALFERFGIEVLATTEGPLDDLRWHRLLRESGWSGRVITAYRPDAVVDPDSDGFAANVEAFGALAGVDATRWDGYLDAHRIRRAYFKDFGATSTDHGHPTARTENLSRDEAAALFDKALRGIATAEEADAFRGHMLTEMARMSLDDGLVLQLHAGALRNHSTPMLQRFGRDRGYDLPLRTDYVRALRPLLEAVGERADLTIIVFTLDESTYARELAPLAGVYPALRLGPAWWFHDSPEGMRRYREMTTETAGFYNTVGFNDDTRAFCSIPARHDVARRVDAAYLATLVATGRIDDDEAFEIAHDLAYRLAKAAYRL
ncbi:glucuronate isomerase [Pleomorphomonas carboxyditropha]|uniref:Uronate isomerase n=1 Tax=Pleomorphomonas carboxyditropha TaxID=2023338 RepID=A0A2G9X2V0_9HYPH|nr:glucuronate isomerase [Pleomorphomonas carboxyditropha]PIP00873.1 glucuronate isomerase [Pleomorphomonas carboxyditropha]